MVPDEVLNEPTGWMLPGQCLLDGHHPTPRPPAAYFGTGGELKLQWHKDRSLDLSERTEMFGDV